MTAQRVLSYLTPNLVIYYTSTFDPSVCAINASSEFFDFAVCFSNSLADSTGLYDSLGSSACLIFFFFL